MVSIRQWLTDADDIKAYTLVRSEFVKHECASMLAVIPALANTTTELRAQYGDSCQEARTVHSTPAMTFRPMPDETGSQGIE